jgi:hypothetical protein
LVESFELGSILGTRPEAKSGFESDDLDRVTDDNDLMLQIS